MQSRIGSQRLAGVCAGLIASASLALLPACQNRAPEPAETKPAAPPASQSPVTKPEAHDTPGQNPAPGAQAMPSGQAIKWSVPGSWQTVPNPNTMRLASYTVGDASGDGPVEVSVSRAGGSTAANIERWQGQFSDSKIGRRAQETVHGLSVTLVEIEGTYSPGAMGAGDNTPHPHWGLVAAIVETPAGSYFFKMLGPKAKVANGASAHDSFEALVSSIAPS